MTKYTVSEKNRRDFVARFSEHRKRNYKTIRISPLSNSGEQSVDTNLAAAEIVDANTC